MKRGYQTEFSLELVREKLKSYQVKISASLRSGIQGVLHPDYPSSGCVMIHGGRSGSTVLADLIGRHAGVHWSKEIMQPFYQRDSAWFFQRPDRLEKYVKVLQRLCGQPLHGFELKFSHLAWMGLEGKAWMDLLQVLGYQKWILLKRKNYLRRLVSSLVVHKTKIAHLDASLPSRIWKITIPVEDVKVRGYQGPLLAIFQEWDQEYASMRQQMEGRDALFLSYEEDVLSDPMVGVRKMGAFLNLEIESLPASYRKTNPFRLSEMIENYHEVRDALIDTPCAWMLEE